MQAAEAKYYNPSSPIVMVDDNEIDLDLARRFYKFSDLQNPFISFSSGMQFLEHMEQVKRGEVAVPCLVLMDINMPEMNGFETLSEIRKQPEFADIPVVVMLTNSDNPADIRKSQQLGANGFQTKQFEFNKYVSFFNSLASK